MQTSAIRSNTILPSRNSVWAGVALACGALMLLQFVKPSQLLPQFDTVAHILVHESMQWTLALALIWMVRHAERRPYASLGLQRVNWPTLGWGVLAGILMLISYPLVQLALKALGLGVSQLGALNLKELPVWLILALALRAGVVEELVFRGFLLERLAWLSGRIWLGALLSLAIFIGAHMKGWSVGHLIYVGVAGGIMTGLYVWRRNLVCNIIAHFITDAIGLMLMRAA